MPRGKKKEKPAAVESIEPAIVAPVEPPPAVSPPQPDTAIVTPVSEREETPKPFQIAHNNLAGVKLFKLPRYKQVQLQFEREVPESIRQELEQDHWRFRPEEGVFTKQYGFDGEAAAIVTARRLFGKLCQQLGGDRSTSVPF